jgi:hypothetical protein
MKLSLRESNKDKKKKISIILLDGSATEILTIYYVHQSPLTYKSLLMAYPSFSWSSSIYSY